MMWLQSGQRESIDEVAGMFYSHLQAVVRCETKKLDKLLLIWYIAISYLNITSFKDIRRSSGRRRAPTLASIKTGSLFPARASPRKKCCMAFGS